MANRSPARWLAPLALAVFVVALVAVVGGSSPDDPGTSNDTSPPAETQRGTDGEGDGEQKEGRRRKTYVVKLGDTPSQIAAETGVSLEQIQKLNPDLDPQLLAPGEKIRIRP